MTRKLKTILKYKGDKKKILLNLYFQKNPEYLKQYLHNRGTFGLFFGLLNIWNNTYLPTPLISSLTLERFTPEYTKDSFTYTVPYTV